MGMLDGGLSPSEYGPILAEDVEGVTVASGAIIAPALRDIRKTQAA